MNEATTIIDPLKVRAKQIRRHILQMLSRAGSGHPGGSLSSADIVTALYFYKMKHDPKNPGWSDRDRLVLSKGHAAPAVYAALAEAGYFPVDELYTLRRLGSILQGHADSTRTPGIDVSTGALGQGLSIGNGLALAARIMRKSYRVFVILGDGEVQEGQVWEAAMTAAHRKIDNLVAIIDRNGLQQTGPTETVKSLEPLVAKWSAFGWHTIAIDGTDMGAIVRALDEACSVKGQPVMIVALTVKGSGAKSLEWVSAYHGKVPEPGLIEEALRELG